VTAINQLLSLTNEFGKALDEGKEIRVVFCDISKAFDRVWHKGLLNKLENIGIQELQSPGVNPDWCGVIILFLSKKL
jgi:hypothetical protein